MAVRVSCTSWFIFIYYGLKLHSWNGFHLSFPLDMFNVVKEGLRTLIPVYFTSGFFTALAGALVGPSDSVPFGNAHSLKLTCGLMRTMLNHVVSENNGLAK